MFLISGECVANKDGDLAARSRAFFGDINFFKIPILHILSILVQHDNLLFLTDAPILPHALIY